MSRNLLYRTLAVPPRWASYWSGFALRQAHSIRQPRILMYHVIGDGDVSPAQFEWQLAFLRRHFEPIGLGALVDRLKAGATSGREVALTFDDGVRNHYEVAWPLLRKYDVPATFFVCPGLTDSGAWMWRTETRMRLHLLDRADLEAVTRNAGCPTQDIEAIMQWTKQLGMDDREAFQRDVVAHTPGFSPPAVEVERHAPLTWDQIHAMDANLITIGSHTRTHPVLPTLSGDALEEEIGGSRRELEQKLDREVDLFSYPNGANDDAVVALARRHYRAAVVARQDIVAEDDDVLLLPRVPGGGARATFVRRMHRPSA